MSVTDVMNGSKQKQAEAARQARVVMPWHPAALPQLCI